MTAKACERCGVVKPLEEFSPHRKTKDGRNKVCKECVPPDGSGYWTYARRFHAGQEDDLLALVKAQI